MGVKVGSRSAQAEPDATALTTGHLKLILKKYVIPAFAVLALAQAVAYASIYYTLTRSRHDTCYTAVDTRDDYRRLFNGIIDNFPATPETAAIHTLVDVLVPQRQKSDCPGYFLDWLL